MTQGDHLLGLLQRAAKAVENAAHPAGVRLQQLEGVIPGIALMNHNIQSKLDRELELLFEQTRLF